MLVDGAEGCVLNHCMPCFSQALSEMTPEICYHTNYGISNWRA